MSLLTVSGLHIEYHTTEKVVSAVRGVGFEVAAGERVGLVGESGSGKTTTALALMRMIKDPGRITAGRAMLDGADLLALDKDAVRAMRLRTVAYVPQGAMNSLNPVLRIRDQMLDGPYDHGIRLDRHAADEKVAEALASVGLVPSVADLYPHQLSGGMKQRVCIAISIMLQPRLLIADEPTSALDVISQRQVARTLRDIQGRIGCGMIIIGHDMGLMAQIADRIIVMKDGVVVEDAATRVLFKSPSHAYSKSLIESVPTLPPAAAAATATDTERVPHIEVAHNATRTSASASPLLVLEGVGRRFTRGLTQRTAKIALHPLSLRIDDADPRIIAIVGQSGSGKTTLARIILGLDTPTEGRIHYRGSSVGALSRADSLRYRREVQAIFQDPYASFNPFYRVSHALIQPLRQFGIATSTDEARDIAADGCAAVGLAPDEVLDRFPHELSGGQRQRLMIARALVLKPRLIVADEPVSMVDASQRVSILDSLSDLRRQGISIIYITHDLATAYHVSDEIIVLHEGRVVEAGAPERVIGRPQHAYTRALVDAVPWPDPDRAWPDVADVEPDAWNGPAVIDAASTSLLIPQVI